MATQVMFSKAVKFEAKGRVALIGPAGAGKSFTALTLARLLAGPDGKIAAADTEHGSLSKYADVFDFDVLELDSYSPDNFLDALTAAEQGGYAVFICDSLSHFWTGKDGALEFVDLAAKRYKDGMGGWKEFRPHERAMVDRMIASPCHIICTMRTKTDYQEVTDDRGKKKRVKVGLAPVQREGLEYEFDLVGYMDDENTLIVDKTRCSNYANKAIVRPSAKDFEPFAEWLKGAARPPQPAPNPQQRKPQQQATVPPPSRSNGNGNGHHAPAPAAPAPTQKVEKWELDKDQLTCFAYDVKTGTGKLGDYVVVKHNGEVKGKNAAFCFHKSMFDALLSARGQNVRLLIDAGGDWVAINDIIQIGEQEYRDGKPYIPEPEPEPVPTQQNLHGVAISDDDIPF